MIRPSALIINGTNGLGIAIADKIGASSSVVLVGDNLQNINIPRHVTAIDFDHLNSIKLSSIKTIIILYHEKKENLVSASDLVNHAKFLADVFHIAVNNNAKILITTSLQASRQYVFNKNMDKDQPYDFSSFQNFVEKLSLEQNRHNKTYIVRLGDVYGESIDTPNVITRMISDVLHNNFIRVDEDGLDRVYPISADEVGKSIAKCFAENLKGGIYTLAPRDGMTQMALANTVIPFASHISHIKFVKTKGKLSTSDPMYENLYNPAPFLPAAPEMTQIEKDIPELIRNYIARNVRVLRQESTRPVVSKSKKKILKPKLNINLQSKKFWKYFISIMILGFFIIFVIFPTVFSLVNTRLTVDGNKIFLSNYNKSLSSEITSDVRYTKEKAQSLIDSMRFIQWYMFALGDDYRANQNFLQAQLEYFDALSYASDYRFLSVSAPSRSIVQLKLQSAKLLINNVDKSKLFWDLGSQFDDIKNIINNAKLEG